MNKDGQLDTALVRLDGPVFIIPMLPIHLNRDLNYKLEWNNETDLKAILGTTNCSQSSNDKSELVEIEKVLLYYLIL